MQTDKTDDGEPEFVRAIKCRACGKLHRITELARDHAGRPALSFRLICIRCGHSDIATMHEIMMMTLVTRRGADCATHQATPSTPPSASPAS